MTKERLSGLALVHIHREINIDIKEVLKRFDLSGHRRIELAIDW